MKLRSWQWAAAAVVISASGAFAGDHMGKLDWVMDPEKGMQRARAMGKPMMIAFSADW